MQTRYFILVLFACGNLFSQSDSLNQIDENNCKFGYWKNYKEFEGQSEKSLLDEGLFVNGLKTGLWAEYYGDNRLKSHLQFIDGLLGGFQIRYYENGDTLEYGYFINSRWIGKHVTFYPNNHQPQNVFYHNKSGKKDGCQSSYFENGKLAKEAEFINGEELSNNEFYANGNPKVISCKGRFHQTFYENNTLKSSINYQKNNSYTETTYFANGKIASVISYKNDKKDGMIAQYYENGNLKLKGAYKDDKMHGDRTYYDYTGKKINNKLVIYDSNHLIEREGFCKNGKPEGEFKVYDSDGNVTMLVNFKNGKPNGNAYFYYNNRLRSTEVYTNGVFVREVGK